MIKITIEATTKKDKMKTDQFDGRNVQPPVMVKCLHCGDIYRSDEGVMEKRFGNPIPLYWCKNKECDGAGYKFDLWPLENSLD